MTSSTITSGSTSFARSTARSPRDALDTSNPERRKFSSSSRTISGSSSTTSTLGPATSSIEGGYPQRAGRPRGAPEARQGSCRLGPVAPVAQGIERRPPEPGAQVRFLPGARGEIVESSLTQRSLPVASTMSRPSHPSRQPSLEGSRHAGRYRTSDRWVSLSSVPGSGTQFPTPLVGTGASFSSIPGLSRSR